MTTEHLKKTVGPLLVVGFEGTQVTESLQNFLEQWDLGGVILFKRNIESLEHVAALNRKIFALARATPIISVDHEGGRVFRLPEPFTAFPPMRKVGRRREQDGDTAKAEAVGRVFGTELRAAGFNLDYAPVLDVDSRPGNPIIGDRAFSSDPEEVARLGLAFLRGLQAQGVLGCGKHFPGHGDTSEDSHLTLPQVKKSLEELQSLEMIPFQKAVEAGIPMLMTAHVEYPALDSLWPATLSEKILTEELRGKMGFRGLVISDDLFMKGISAKWGLEEAAERYLRAGGDLVLLCHQESVQRRIAAHLVHRAERDSGFRILLEEKSRRVNDFRKKLSGPGEPSTLTQVGCEEHRRLAQSLS